MGDYRIEQVSAQHDRAAFSCGIAELDNYLHRQARQDSERKLAAVFILTTNGAEVAGFYTLSATSVSVADLPDSLREKLPRFPVPATLLGRMAVSRALQGRRLGEFLLLHALKRALSGSLHVASWAVLVDAKEHARNFYIRHGFTAFPEQPSRLLLPMATISKLFPDV